MTDAPLTIDEVANSIRHFMERASYPLHYDTYVGYVRDGEQEVTIDVPMVDQDFLELLGKEFGRYSITASWKPEFIMIRLHQVRFRD